MEGDSCVGEVQPGNSVEGNSVNAEGDGNEEKNDSVEIGDNNMPENVFSIDRSCIPTVPQTDQDNELLDLNIQVYQQDILEKGILNQVDEAFEKELQRKKKKQEIREAKRLKKAEDEAKADENAEDKSSHSINVGLVHLEETEMERRIRMGEMTPFGTYIAAKSTEMNNYENVEEYLRNQLQLQEKNKGVKRKKTQDKIEKSPKLAKKNHSPLKKKVFFPRKRKRKEILGTEASEEWGDLQKSPGKLLSEKTAMEGSSGSEYYPGGSESETEERPKIKKVTRPKRVTVRNSVSEEDWKTDDSDWEYSDNEKNVSRKSRKTTKELDDGNVDDYLKRLKTWERNNNREEIESQVKNIDNGFKIPSVIWNKLYNYQKVGVQWLWELNIQRCGGILGDEMGLGKTIQVIAFLAGLSISKLISRHGNFKGLGPTLIVCPTTVMHQWVKEFHQWWPQFRVALLHESGSYLGKRSALVQEIVKTSGILVTSYVSCSQQSDILLRYKWHYVILDEGHKIRNPESQVANAVKQLRTPHRLILSGSPMQNNLKELWSLFDFIFPGKLGTQPVFMAEFAVPITQGGYTNASQVQVATAYKCATVLRDTISPYLLRRMKEDVKSHINLPEKNEQVLFCRLTEEQRQLYIEYLNSGEVDRILTGRYQIFVGLINLRKICNHPHLYSGGPKLFKWDNVDSIPEEDRYGYWEKAGKMIVVQTLLKIWNKQGHRVLIFTQSRQMLHILEAFLQSQNYEYLKLDGTTNIGSRQPLINKFNEDKKYFVFLSTTHVGGLGVNLTGADRVVIYDPDWNPATDTQARERAWRIGQQNQVTIYRLVTSGTIEEKIYHRQIFKQFLTNKVLKDPRQRRFFKSNDLYELFTLKEADDNGTETSALFAGTGSEVKLKDLTHRQRVKKIKDKMSLNLNAVGKTTNPNNNWSQEKIEEMRKMAQALSKKISESCSNNNNNVNSEGNEKNSVKEQNENAVSKNGIEKNNSNPKEKHKKHKKRKRRKDAKFDGEVVPHLLKQKTFNEVAENDADHKAQDDYILKKLLSKTSVQTALKHDRIMEGGPSDYALVEAEADKVAKEAVRALKESRRRYQSPYDERPPPVNLNVSKGKPRFGIKKSIGRPFGNSSSNQGNDGEKNVAMSSAELLSRIRERNRLLSDNDQHPPNPLDEHSELLADIRNFISFGAVINNRATTQEILDRFRDRLPAGRSPLFKALLLELCEFHRTSNGEGIWQLRPEFQW